jgi:hypothetical protein
MRTRPSDRGARIRRDDPFTLVTMQGRAAARPQLWWVENRRELRTRCANAKHSKSESAAVGARQETPSVYAGFPGENLRPRGSGGEGAEGG